MKTYVLKVNDLDAYTIDVNETDSYIELVTRLYIHPTAVQMFKDLVKKAYSSLMDDDGKTPKLPIKIFAMNPAGEVSDERDLSEYEVTAINFSMLDFYDMDNISISVKLKQNTVIT